ncbi:hypothetical protein HYW44_05365, partial [Candidatus Daviesbacteria bacterium]|nr:hypothetical protein [Candidatus Daviesbacteria bacterium]
DFSIDGTLSFTGSSINAFPTLFLQNNPLASLVDIFNGKVTINKDGLFEAESLALGDQSVGEAVILAGQTEVTINSSLITSASHIFLTPSTPVSGNLYVGQLLPARGFKVKLSEPNLSDVKFNWLIIQSKEASN